MNEEIIKLIDIQRHFKVGTEIVRALRGITLSMKRNEFVALMGPSGSGKSTLMNLLGCLDTPTNGQYFLNGQDVSKMDDNELAEVRNKEIGFVFQTFNLLPRSTALENVMLPLVYAGQNKSARLERAKEVLADVQLTDRMAHKPNELSGGQRQRVAVAGNTIIVVTHEESIARHAHRIIRLIDGQVESDEINENPAKVSDYHMQEA